jgi:hypothetical protein
MDRLDWPLCLDHGAVHRHSLRVLSDLCREPGDLTIAFSGGADSWFLVLCLHQLIEMGQVDRHRVQIWTGDYQAGGRSLTPGSGQHEYQLAQLGFDLNRVCLWLDDPRTQEMLIEKFYESASHNAAQVAQAVVMDRFPGRVLVGEGGPAMVDCIIPELRGTRCAMVVAEYESGNRTLFHATDPDLWGSWLIPENVDFQQPLITQRQYLSLTAEQQWLWRTMRYHWRYLLYSRGFPQHGDKFLWKNTSWLGLWDLPQLEKWRGHMRYQLEHRNQHLRQRLDAQDWLMEPMYYQRAWLPLRILR